jgi:pyruvate formate lyase activating enzyme
MIVGGFQKLSLIDYPGKVCAIIYTRGCNFRCPYCHNPELVWPECYGPEVELDSVFDFLKKRQGLLDAVTITGGEPTLHEDLQDIIREIKALDFLVKLDTNGSRPEVLKALLRKGLLDYVAMDVKAPIEKYSTVSGIKVDTASIEESIRILLCGEVDYEFRTTVDRTFLNEDDLLQIGALIQGAKKFYMQIMNPNDAKQEGSSKHRQIDEDWLKQIAVRLSGIVEFCEVR